MLSYFAPQTSINNAAGVVMKRGRSIQSLRQPYDHGTAKTIIICGSGYSGSTLLNLLLGSHPDLVSLGETTNLARSVIEDRQCTCRQPVKQCSFWNDVRREIVRVNGIDIFNDPANFPVSLLTDRNTVTGNFVHFQRLALAGLGFVRR